MNYFLRFIGVTLLSIGLFLSVSTPTHATEDTEVEAIPSSNRDFEDTEVEGAESRHGYSMWRCDAWPISGPWVSFYWVHSNIYIAQRNAVRVCNSQTFQPCIYQCYLLQYW